MHAGKMITLTLTLLLLLPVTACNTVEGFGEDLESLGKNLQSSAASDDSHQSAVADKSQTGKTSSRFDQWQKPAAKQR